MLALRNISIEKSIASKRLYYSRKWIEYVDLILYPFAIVLGFVICPYLIYRFELNWENVNERFIGYFVLPIVMSYGTYMTIRTYTQFKLRKINTHRTREENQQLILSFAQNEEFVVRRKFNYCIVLDDRDEFGNTGRTAVLLLREDAIYFTYLQDNLRVNTPTFISHLIFSMKLRKWMKKSISSSMN